MREQMCDTLIAHVHLHKEIMMSEVVKNERHGLIKIFKGLNYEN